MQRSQKKHAPRVAIKESIGLTHEGLQEAVKKAPQAELSKAEKKRLRQERDPHFKEKNQLKKGRQQEASPSEPEQASRLASERQKERHLA